MAISNGQESKVISPSRLAHIVLRTSAGEGFQKMVNFYKTFLGGEASWENDYLSFITYDEEHHRVAIVGLPEIGPRNTKHAGLEHMAFTFNKLSDLLKSYHQRKALGITPVWCVNHGVTLSIYYRDPDGNQIETQVDIFDTSEEATAYMNTKDYAENPFGVDFVPEEIEERLKSGEPVKDILKRGNIGPRDISTVPLIHAQS